MIQRKSCLVICIYFIINIVNSASIFSQDTLPKESIKKGWSFGGVPAIAYNTDKGFQYGIIGNVYNFGDGSSYPNYKYSFQGEVSRTTKGNGINDIFVDLRNVLPHNLRLTVVTGYYTNLLLPFFGFNGYDSKYNYDYINPKSTNYISRVYYTQDRRLFRFCADLQGPMKNNKFRWVAGLGIYDFKIAPVDVISLNKKLNNADKLPIVPSLYEKYIAAGIIPASQKNGGIVNYVKTGLVFDTRNNEPNPNSGYWVEATFLVAPKFLANKDAFGQLCFIYRHYLTISKPRLTFAYRLAYQSVIAGDKPFYFLPYLISSFKTQEAFGGVKTIRGVLAQRVQGKGVVFGNLEFRYKFMFFNLFNQNFYLSANTFLDGGQVIEKYKFNSNVPLSDIEIDDNREAIHLGAGAGIRFVMNQNFIISVDYGKALNKNDGDSGLYVDLDFLF